jgi:hypothetical protein
MLKNIAKKRNPIPCPIRRGVRRIHFAPRVTIGASTPTSHHSSTLTLVLNRFDTSPYSFNEMCVHFEAFLSTKTTLTRGGEHVRFVKGR